MTGDRVRSGVLSLLALLFACAVLRPAVANADPVVDFYKGRTFTILVGQEPGTGFDIYSRTLARHFSRYIPGNPGIVVQNMTGASGVNAGNWLYNIAPKDGTVMGTFSQNVVVEPLFGNQSAKYDATRMLWIGNMEESASVCGVSPEANVMRFGDLLTREIVFGATGPTGPLGQAARALNMIVGTKLKIIYGYKGSATIKLAMAKGEVHGICGLPWSTIKAFWQDDLDTKRFKPIIQLSAKRLPEFGDIAHIDDYVKSDETRQLVDLIFGQLVLGRIYATPPGVPAERIEALRKAFMATMQDKDFLADAERTRIDIIPATGEQVDALIKRFYMVPPAVVEQAKKTIDPQ
jgi:tripartite-type tricarboxylate transporter receptor subunit TctC